MLSITTPATSRVADTTASPHAAAWANLIFEAQRFRERIANADEAAENNPNLVDEGNVVAALVGFVSPVARVSDYEMGQTQLRMCLTTSTGEFFTSVESVPLSDTAFRTTTLGTGECDYTNAADIYTTTSGVERGEDLLTSTEPHYATVSALGEVVDPDPVEEVLDGRNESVLDAAVLAGRAVGGFKLDADHLPSTLTPARLTKMGATLPAGVRLGWYDNRDGSLYRLCLTDGTEEAVYESAIDTHQVVRHSSGTCRV